MTKIYIEPANSAAERLAFIHFQWQIYAGDPHWVPPLISERKAFWDKTKNPFFEHSDAQMFVAKRDGKIVGTIAAIHNTRHCETHKDKIGFFGGFECIDDASVSIALFEAVAGWLRARGLDTMRGPATLSVNDEVGLLVEGEPGQPQPLMTYNPQYYRPLVEGHGFKKSMDLWAWWNPIKLGENQIDDKVMRVAEIAMKRGKFTLRQADIQKHLAREVDVIRKIYGSYEGAWAANWGFVPFTEHELQHAIKGLKGFAENDLIYIAEKDGEAIGFSITLPNVNTPLRMAYPNPGTPEPITLLKMLWHWKVRKVIRNCRFMLLGVLPEYRAAGVDAALIAQTIHAARARGYEGGELGWILENNDPMNKVNKLGGGHVYRTYRMYDCAL